jgi:hypothetical protein
MPSSLLARVLIVPLLVAGLVACDDDDGPLEPTGPFDLSFSGDATFQGAHGGQALSVVVRTVGGTEVAAADGTVSATADPSFAFNFTGILERNTSYELVYWVDSNFGGGAEGVCDPPVNDHQWLIEIGQVTGDETIEDTHRPTETESVCSAF